MKKEKKRPLSEEEKRLAEDPNGWEGMTGLEAPLALRGATDNSTTEEKILYAIAIVQKGELGLQSVALRGLEAGLRKIRS